MKTEGCMCTDKHVLEEFNIKLIQQAPKLLKKSSLLKSLVFTSSLGVVSGDLISET